MLKSNKFCSIVALLLICSLLVWLYYPQVIAEDSPQNSTSRDFSEPMFSKPSWLDENNNGIADTLDREINKRTMNNTIHDYTDITVLLKAAPTIQDTTVFGLCNGYLTALWTEAVYGFSGRIQYKDIVDFVEKCSNVLLVEKQAIGKVNVAYAAQQIGARTYVWNTLRLQGDSDSSTAVLDTGIDASHVDFQPGYGNQDFSRKIIGWNDQIRGTTSPLDDNGHGSHVAGLAAGNGFFSVDASGNAITTWGADLGQIHNSGTLPVGGVPVNKPGTITVNVKWNHTGTGSTLSGIVLLYGDKTLSQSSWTQLSSVSTPNQNIFYSVNYTVTSVPLNSFDIYHIGLNVTSGSSTSHLYVAFTVSWPYTPPSDSFMTWTGIAPQSKLVGIKVANYLGEGTTSELVRGIQWLISNKLTYHITVASISLGFENEVAIIDSAVTNLVNNGITVVVAGGNNGSGSNHIFSPGSVDEAITVSAMNQFDAITGYSNQGGTSRYSGKTIKPDITSPGGSLLGLPIFSADSNSKDAEGNFAEIQIDDSAPMQGTSMATPIISGCAQIVIQAMGGFSGWRYTRTQALQPKLILLMTATETYPNLREANTSSVSPTLDRGEKDVHEGYGRVNLDAAVDAILKSYNVGSVVTDTLGQPPTIANTSSLGERLAWARNVQLVGGTDYSFSLNVPDGADYDLYLYDSAGTAYGEPVTIDKSTNATSGGTEQFWVNAPYSGTYYLVIKRATEVSGSGTFTLASSGARSVIVTLNTIGLQSAPNVVHYVQNGIAKNGNIIGGTFSDAVDPSTTISIDSTIYVSSMQRYITADPTSFSVQSSATYTINYRTQFYIRINSTHGIPTNSQWVDQGGNLIVSVISPTEIVSDDHQWICTGYTLDDGSTHASVSYTFNNIQAAHTLTFNWKEQFYLTVTSAYGSVSGDGWYDSGTTATASLSAGTVPIDVGVQQVFAGWGTDATGSFFSSSEAIIMNGPKTAKANWKTQYYLSISSNFGTVNPNSNWYDAESKVTISTTPPSAGSGERYVWNNWTGIGINSYSGNDTQTSLTMKSPINETASWNRQYLLTVISYFDSPSPSTNWFDAGTSVTASILSSTQTSIITQTICKGWTGTGSVPKSGTINMVEFTISQPSSIIWNSETRYLLLPLLIIIIVPVMLIVLVVILLRQRRNRVNK